MKLVSGLRLARIRRCNRGTRQYGEVVGYWLSPMGGSERRSAAIYPVVLRRYTAPPMDFLSLL